MARWLVNRNDTHLVANGMAELREMAKSGKLGPGDLIQPPGAQDWLYAVEVPELKELMAAGGGAAARAYDDDLDATPKSGGGLGLVVVAILVAIVLGGGYAMVTYGQRIPGADSGSILDMGFSKVVVTGKGLSLRSAPEAGAASVAPVQDGKALTLLGKRGAFYRVRDDGNGAEGYVEADQVLPMYLLGGGDVMKEYDPLYNPDRYVDVMNASWMQLPEQREEQITVFQFMLRNQSSYDMTDLVMSARIKDPKGHELETVEFRVEGMVPAQGTTMVGTLTDPETQERRLITQVSFDEMAADDPELRLQYTDGVEVKMESDEVTEASIDIVELRAVPRGSGS